MLGAIIKTYTTMKHILLNRTFEYRKRKKINSLEGHIYNLILGG